jgi:hypothetical protein
MEQRETYKGYELVKEYHACSGERRWHIYKNGELVNSKYTNYDDAEIWIDWHARGMSGIYAGRI